VYFRDPEHNGVEVFIDTPWHVRQPQGEPLDLDKTNDEIVAATIAHFSKEPEFGPIDAFYARRAQHLAGR
jgi:catechol 2,3-dioxygenase